MTSATNPTLDEYQQLFDLDLDRLKGRAVLDVAAGPASFTAEAVQRGISAVAVDPLYKLRRPEIEQHLGDQAAEAARFLADYENGFARSRYVAGALPQLPFFDRAFDLVLCAHLLFVYANQFDFTAHVAACVELVRVSSDEARVHPLGGPNGKPNPNLKRLRLELDRLGIASEVGTMLRLRRK